MLHLKIQNITYYWCPLNGPTSHRYVCVLILEIIFKNVLEIFYCVGLPKVFSNPSELFSRLLHRVIL